jgi:hypothetical protein
MENGSRLLVSTRQSLRVMSTGSLLGSLRLSYAANAVAISATGTWPVRQAMMGP